MRTPQSLRDRDVDRKTMHQPNPVQNVNCNKMADYGRAEVEVTGASFKASNRRSAGNTRQDMHGGNGRVIRQQWFGPVARRPANLRVQ